MCIDDQGEDAIKAPRINDKNTGYFEPLLEKLPTNKHTDIHIYRYTDIHNDKQKCKLLGYNGDMNLKKDGG